MRVEQNKSSHVPHSVLQEQSSFYIHSERGHES